MRRTLLAVLFSLCPFYICSCGAIEGCGGNVMFNDPLFHITRATDSTTGAAIPKVILSNMTYVGTPVEISQFGLTYPPAFGVTVEGSTLVCNVPCGFGTEEGRYTFSVSAPNYKTSSVAQEGRFQSHGGCPLTYSGSTDMQFTLQPQ
jgi:hypothetical protein